MTDKHKPSVWQLHVDEADIAWLSIDCVDEKLNTLDHDALDALSQIIDQLNIDLPKGLVLLSAKQRGFIAGAQIKEFARIKTQQQAAEKMRFAHDIYNRIEAMVVPKVALIHGVCFGGGLELALCFDYLIAEDDPGCKLGLPEVKLGIHPGYGGSVRLIERIGVPKAMEMMLSGRAVIARSARKIGLLDQVVAKRYFTTAAKDYIARAPMPQRAAGLYKLLYCNLARQLLSKYLYRQLRQRANPAHYPAPFALIELWRKFGRDRKQMLEQEIESVATLAVGETARNLVRLFYLQEGLKTAPASIAPVPLKHLHVIGAGVMGGDIAAWSALSGIRVTLQDQNALNLARAMVRAKTLFRRKLKISRNVQAAMDRLMPDMQGQGIESADLIIEAIFENLEAKQAVLSDVESRAKANALIASNTSSIPIESIAASFKQPNRLVGIHFFNPVAKMQLIEIVRGKQSDGAFLEMAKAYAMQINRLPVEVKSAPGFLVNRVLMPYLIEAVTMHDEGINAAELDQAAVDFGMPMGPIELADVVGLDICLHVAENLPGNQATPGSLKQKVESENVGRKSGQGYYTWHKGKPQKTAFKPGSASSAKALSMRMLYPLLNECLACLREGIVSSADELDAGVIFGTGFAPFKGGPMQLAASVGRDKMREQLQQLAIQHGERFTPDPGWEDDTLF